MNSQLRQLAGWLAYAASFMWFAGLAGHIVIYASGLVVPVTRSHSALVESLGAATFLCWSLFALVVYHLLKPVASRPARCGLALGVIAMPYLGLLELLFALEVVWFSDTLSLSMIGYVAAGIWGVTVLLLTRAPGRALGTSSSHAIRTFISIVVYPLWPVLIWRRVLSRLTSEPGSESLPAEPAQAAGQPR